MTFDPTITLGHLISGLISISAIFVALWRLKLQLDKLQWKMNLIWRWYAKTHKLNGNDKADG